MPVGPISRSCSILLYSRRMTGHVLSTHSGCCGILRQISILYSIFGTRISMPQMLGCGTRRNTSTVRHVRCRESMPDPRPKGGNLKEGDALPLCCVSSFPSESATLKLFQNILILPCVPMESNCNIPQEFQVGKDLEMNDYSTLKSRSCVTGNLTKK